MKENTNVNMVAEENTAEQNTAEASEPVTPNVEMVVSEEVSHMTPAQLMSGSGTEMYCSVVNDGSMQNKAKVYNMINNPDKRISDVIGEVINMKDILAHNIDVVSEETGELMTALRVVIIDAEGISYEAVSQGVSNSLQRIMDIFGQPNTWESPIPVKAVQKSTRNGNNKVTILKVEM